jgi:hypothetical protein
VTERHIAEKVIALHEKYGKSQYLRFLWGFLTVGII